MIESLISKLRRINIVITVVGNVPWVYLTSVNGKAVTKKFSSEWGFVIGYTPIRDGQRSTLSNIGEIFKVIRELL